MSSVVEAFQPVGNWTVGNNTVALTPGGSSVSAVILGSPKCVQVYNSSTVAIHIAFGQAGLVATPAVVGTPGNAVPVAPGAIIVFGIPANANTVAANGASGTIYFTFGEGL